MSALLSRRYQVLAEAVRRLDASGLSGEPVELDPAGEFNAAASLQVYDQGHQLIESEAGCGRYRIGFTIEGYAEGTTAEEANLARDRLFAGAVRALFTESETGWLGDLIEELEDGTLTVGHSNSANLGREFVLEMFAIFTTRRGDPASA